MPGLRYKLGRAFVGSIRLQCVREFVIGRRHMQRSGGFVIACTHLSHLEPAIVSCHTRRHITWIARVEFFRWRWLAPILKMAEALPIDRQGRSVRTIRRAIDLTRRGEIVGIFPEGGVATGTDAMFRGGTMKRGACVIAIRGNVPIVPCVVLGTEKLNRVAPWLPFKRAGVWVAYGEPIFPPPNSMHRRAARFEMAERLQREIMRTYQQLLERSGLRDEQVA
jgi:1-acyl-sn-glycerol-3-phosphate acyltransferase